MPSTDPASSADRIALLVLGMHRSGTSALSGTLSKIGYGLPVTLAPADHNNRNGYFESKALWKVNDALLAEIGSGWDDWSAVDMQALPGDLYARSRTRAIELIKAEYDHHDGPVLLKDPRMCRNMPLWIDALGAAGYATHVVHTHRHPSEVAASLHRRDGYDPAYGLLMWLRHVLEAESATRALPRAFTTFNTLMQDWQNTIKTLHQRLGLPPPDLSDETQAEVQGFLNAKLRNFDTPAGTLEGWWQDSFDILERWARDGEDKSDHPRLNGISAALDGLAPQVSALVRPGQRAVIAQAAMQAEQQDQSADNAAQLAAKDTQITTKSALLETLEAQNRQLHLDIGARDQTIEDMSAELKHLRAAVAEKEEKLTEFLAVIEERGAALQDRANDIEWFRTELENRETQAIALQREIIEREEAVQTLESENTMLTQHAALSDEAKKALMESASWRLTAPLRSVVGRLKGGS